MTNRIMPSPQPVLLDRFRGVLLRDGAAAARAPTTLLDQDADRQDELFYMPFEHTNFNARLVIVGITPGPNQIALAYGTVQACLKGGLDDATTLARTKAVGSFGGPKMRPNLLKMLEAFGFPDLLGISDAADLWDVDTHLLHATSTVPHAVFRNGKPFAGSFKDVLGSPIMKACFERDFAAILPLLSPKALYVALGPTPLAALDWCAAQGLIRSEQVMGAFAHPSSTGGSRVPVYLGKKVKDDLDEKDPVRNSVDWLVKAASRMRRSVIALGGTPLSVGHAIVSKKPIVHAAPIVSTSKPSTKGAGAAPETLALQAIVTRGKNKGLILRPHIDDGCFIVSLTKYEIDYVRVSIDQPLEPWLTRGYRLRMSGPNHPAGLIRPESVQGRKCNT